MKAYICIFKIYVINLVVPIMRWETKNKFSFHVFPTDNQLIVISLKYILTVSSALSLHYIFRRVFNIHVANLLRL